MGTNIQMQKTTRFPLFDMGLQIGLWEESRLRLFENRVQNKYLNLGGSGNRILEKTV
jgi:hypothetical protein